jgi:hypothetical protein
MSNYIVQADVMGTKNKRRMPDAGLISSGYVMELMGNHQRLQIRSWASEFRIKKEIDFPWQPDTWYTLKLEINYNNGSAEIRGKAWPKTEPEPASWTIVAEDPLPIRNGSPGLSANSTTELYFDNVLVTSKDTK